MYRKATGLEIPRNSRQQWAAGRPVPTSEAEPGDIFVFDTTGSGPSHVALYLGDGSIIQAVSEGPRTGVIVSSMSDPYWASCFLGARDFLRDVSGARSESGGLASRTGADSAATTGNAAGGTGGAAPAKGTADGAAGSAAGNAWPGSAATPSPARTASTQIRSGQTEAGASRPADSTPVSEIGLTLGPRPSVITDRIPTEVGSMLAFTITNERGSAEKFLIDFYKDNADFGKIVHIRHIEVLIEAGGHYRLEPVLFDEPGRYRLNIKSSGNIQLFQRSFEVVSIGSGGAIQDYTGTSAPAPEFGPGTKVEKLGLIVGAEAPSRGGSLQVAKGSAILIRVANGTPAERGMEFLLYRLAEDAEGNTVLTDERARLPSGAWIELSPVLLTEAGIYRFLVKSNQNDLLLQRTILVEPGR